MTIYNLKVEQGIVSEKDMLAWNPAYAQELPRETGSAVDYTLKKSFAGNGADSFVDTGMKLYDVAIVSLPAEEQQRLAAGIPVSDKGALERLLEDYTS